MEYYHWVLIGAAAMAALVAWNVPRAHFWLALGALSYVTSAMWHNAGFPHGTYYGAATNLLICAGFWVYADQRWEMRLWNCFHLMLIIDILFIAGFIKDQFTFAASLELINLIAILLIAGTGLVQRVDGIYRGPYHRGWLDSVHRRLWPARSLASRPWWQKAA